jgi:hypothetical protein
MPETARYIGLDVPSPAPSCSRPDSEAKRPLSPRLRHGERSFASFHLKKDMEGAPPLARGRVKCAAAHRRSAYPRSSAAAEAALCRPAPRTGAALAGG